MTDEHRTTSVVIMSFVNSFVDNTQNRDGLGPDCPGMAFR